MDIPAEVISPGAQALLDDLLGRGYSVGEKRYDNERFGDALIVVGRETTRIRLIRDRGEWFVEVAGADDWFSPVVWRAFLQSAMPSLEIVPFEAQARWLLEDLDRIEALDRDLTEDQLAGLRTWRSRRAQARRELPPIG